MAAFKSFLCWLFINVFFDSALLSVIQITTEVWLQEESSGDVCLLWDMHITLPRQPVRELQWTERSPFNFQCFLPKESSHTKEIQLWQKAEEILVRQRPPFLNLSSKESISELSFPQLFFPHLAWLFYTVAIPQLWPCLFPGLVISWSCKQYFMEGTRLWASPSVAAGKRGQEQRAFWRLWWPEIRSGELQRIKSN